MDLWARCGNLLGRFFRGLRLETASPPSGEQPRSEKEVAPYGITPLIALNAFLGYF